MSNKYTKILQPMSVCRILLLAIFIGGFTACSNMKSPAELFSGSEIEGVDSDPQFGYYAKQEIYHWDENLPISVCYVNSGTIDFAPERKWVREAIESTWGAYSGLQFKDWGECPAWPTSCSDEGQCIRIQIDNSEPIDKETGAFVEDYSGTAWGLGKKIDNLPIGVNLRYAKSFFGKENYEDDVTSVAVHEFGHALGLAHEQMRDDTDFDDASMPQAKMLLEFLNVKHKPLGPYDRESIMNYSYFSTLNNALSYGDIITIREMYGWEAPDQAAMFVTEHGRMVHNGKPDFMPYNIPGYGPYYDWRTYDFFETSPGESQEVTLKIENLGSVNLELFSQPRVHLTTVFKETDRTIPSGDIQTDNINGDGTPIFSVVQQPAVTVIRPQLYGKNNGALYGTDPALAIPFVVRFRAQEKGVYAAQIVIPYRYFDSTGAEQTGNYVFMMQGESADRQLSNMQEVSFSNKDFGDDPARFQKELADVTGDGKADMIVQSTGKDGWRASVAVGNGDGTFKPAVSQTLLNWELGDDVAQYTKSLGDLDGDGDMDLVIQSTDIYGWHTCVALNNCNKGVCSPGQLFFASGVQTLRAGNYGWDPARFTKLVGDVSGDGKADLVLQTTDSNGWRGFCALSKGNGIFEPGTKQTLRSGDYGTDYSRFTKLLGDMDGDGDMDLVLQTVDYNNGWRGFVAPNGCSDGTCPTDDVFQAGKRQDLIKGVGEFSSDYYRYAKQVADVNGDGIGDLVLQTTDSLGYFKGIQDLYAVGWRVFIALGTKEGAFVNIHKEVLWGAHFGLDPSRFTKHCADVDGDGKVDLIVQTSDRWRVLVSHGNGDGSFDTATKRTLMTDNFGTAYDQYTNCIGDINGDGMMDLMLQKTNSYGWRGFFSFYNQTL